MDDHAYSTILKLINQYKRETVNKEFLQISRKLLFQQHFKYFRPLPPAQP